jgi:hypothetical protein
MPRPPLRTVRPTPAAPRVRDFTSPRPPSLRVVFDVRTVYDFVFSLGCDAGATDDLPASDRRWLVEARAAVGVDPSTPPKAELSDLVIVLGGLAVDRPEIRTAADFVRLLDAVPADVVARTILAEDLRDPAAGDLVSRALAGDPAAVEAFVADHLEEHPAERRELLTTLFRDPTAAYDRLRTLVTAWRPRRRAAVARPAVRIAGGAHRADDRRGPLGRRAGHHTGDPGPLVLRPAVQLRPGWR